jgi:hypothetical protein
LNFQEKHMATIIIKDLSENLDLDRKAMQAIAGGSRLRSRARATAAGPVRAPGIVDFRTGVAPRGTPFKQTK